MRSSCSHCVATCSSTPPPPGSGMASAASRPRNAWSCMPISYVPSTTTSPATDWSPRTIRWWRSTLPSGWIGRARAGDDRLGIEQRVEHLVLDDDRRERPPAGLGMVGGDGGDRLADVAHDVAREHRLVLVDQAVGELAGHVVGGDDGLDAGDPPRRRHVDAHDAGVRVRRAQRGAPQHAVAAEVGRELERALHLGDAVGPHGRRAEHVAADPGVDRAHDATAPPPSASTGARRATATRCTASMMRP